MGKIKEFMKKYGHWALAAVIFLLLLTLVCGYRQLNKESYRIVCLGDSIIGNERGDTSITGILQDILEEPVYNGAFGGSTMARRQTQDRAAVTTDTLSMVKLSESIAHQDFSVQNAGVTRCAVMDYFPDSVYKFQHIDFSKVEILVIEHGVNDYLAGVPLENPQDPFDEYTYAGALRQVLKNLRQAYPEQRVILVTPTYCWFLFKELNCGNNNTGSGILEDYVNMELAIAAEYGVEVLDNYHHSGIGDTGVFEEWEIYTQDGLHLNEKGRRLVAERIADCILEEGK